MIGPLSVSSLPSIKFDGFYRVLGCLPSKPENLAKFPKFGENFQAITSNDWQEIDLEHYNLPILNQGASSACFPAGTPILMGDGTERDIEQVGVGNKVVSHTGKVKTVTEIFERDYKGLTYSIKVKGWSYPLRMTEEHPVAVCVGDELTWVNAKNLKIGDWALMPSFTETEGTNNAINVSDYLSDDFIVDKDGCRLALMSRVNCINEKINLDEEFATFIGLFLAEGCYVRNGHIKPCGIALTFNRNEKELHDLTVYLLKSLFGCSSKVDNCKKKDTVTRVICMNSTLARFMQTFCGEYSTKKFLNSVFFTASKETKVALIRGWLYGDGQHFPIRYKNRKDGKSRNVIQCDGVTASKHLHRGLFYLAISCGLKPGATIRRQEDHQTCESRNLNFYSSDVLKLFPEHAKETEMDLSLIGKRKTYKKHKFGVLCKIVQISQKYDNLKVYNFEVEEDHSYIANGIAVHNCVGHGCASGCEMAWMQAGRDLREFSPWFLYALINGGRDAGAAISDALTALQGTGICPRSDVPEGVLFENQLPQTAISDASKFKVINAFHCRDYSEICSSISLGFPTPLGIAVGQNFVQLDDEGVAPLPYSILGGHCLLGIGLKKSAKYGWVIKVKNSWGCYDKETEVLTKEGWKPFPKIDGHELIVTLNPSSHEIEYQNIEHVHVYPYSGNLIKFKSRDIDLVVTPNHNMFVKTLADYRNNKDWQTVRADKCKKHLYMKKNAVWSGKEVEYYEVAGKKITMDVWLEFLGYFLSEGSATLSTYKVGEWKGKRKVTITDKETGLSSIVVKDRIEKSRMQTSYAVAIHQSKSCNIEKINSCLEKLPFKFTRHKNTWTVNCKGLWEELRVLGKAPNKYLPDYVKCLSSRQQRIIYDALMLGDGSIGETASRRTYFTSSRRLADDVQELALKIGYCGDVTITDRVGRKNTSGNTYRELEYKVGIKYKQLEQHSTYEKIEVPYCDYVYCVTVPNHIIYVRRNGRAVWCGNSNFGIRGCCYLQEGALNYMQPDAFAIQTMSIDSNDPNAPPVVV